MNTQETDSKSDSVRPEWYRITEATRVSGIGRTSLYDLMRKRRIKSKVVKVDESATRGLRVVNADSLLGFIESFGDGFKAKEDAAEHSSRELAAAL